uniref:Reverse transcriptase domain-containing protein n=1 Tax=Steinernema glaseri TaxID=37863 RepID=A0A1I8AQH9_9BILA
MAQDDDAFGSACSSYIAHFVLTGIMDLLVKQRNHCHVNMDKTMVVDSMGFVLEKIDQLTNRTAFSPIFSIAFHKLYLQSVPESDHKIRKLFYTSSQICAIRLHLVL